MILIQHFNTLDACMVYLMYPNISSNVSLPPSHPVTPTTSLAQYPVP